MRLGIMQPYFFPYLGYWQLLANVDKYVVYVVEETLSVLNFLSATPQSLIPANLQKSESMQPLYYIVNLYLPLTMTLLI